MLCGFKFRHSYRIVFSQGRKERLIIVISSALFVRDTQEAVKDHHLPVCLESSLAIGPCRPLKEDASSFQTGVRHLGCQRSPPNEFVEPTSILVDVGRKIGGVSELFSGRPDSFVGLLSAGVAGLIAARLIGKVLVTEALFDFKTSRSQGLG